MSNPETHEAEQRAITEQWENCRATVTPCERAVQIMYDTDANPDNNARRAARVLLAIAPAYDGDDTKTGIVDALSDLLHLCDVAGWNFAKIEAQARRHYRREIGELGPANDDALRAAIERN